MDCPPHPIFHNVANEPERGTNIIRCTQLLQLAGPMQEDTHPFMLGALD